MLDVDGSVGGRPDMGVVGGDDHGRSLVGLMPEVTDDHAWSDLVETMGIEPTTPCSQTRKMVMSANFASYRIVSDYAI